MFFFAGCQWFGMTPTCLRSHVDREETTRAISMK